MGITWEMLAMVAFLTVLALLFTGPGMWSERWGWKWFGDEKKRPEDER